MPDLSVFRILKEEEEGGEGEREAAMFPGKVMVSPTLPSIEINSLLDSSSSESSSWPHLIEMAVTNTGDRPIQVGSHYRESKVIDTYCVY